MRTVGTLGRLAIWTVTDAVVVEDSSRKLAYQGERRRWEGGRRGCCRSWAGTGHEQEAYAGWLEALRAVESGR